MSQTRDGAVQKTRIKTPIILSNNVIDSILSVGLTTAGQALLEDYLISNNYNNEDLTYCLCQILRFAILYEFGFGPLHIAAAPFLQHYFNRFFEDETIANYLATGTFFVYGLATHPASLPGAAFTSTINLTAAIATKEGADQAYQMLKNTLSLFKPYAPTGESNTPKDILGIKHKH